MMAFRTKISIREVDGCIVVNGHKKNIIQYCQKEAFSKFNEEMLFNLERDLFNAKYDFYHKLYYPRIQYNKFEILFPKKDYAYTFLNKARLYRYIVHSTYTPIRDFLYNTLDQCLTKLHNFFVWKPQTIIVFEYQEDDTRNSEIMQYVKRKHNTNFANGTTISSKIKNFFNSNQLFILRHKHTINPNLGRYIEEKNIIFEKQLLYYKSLLKEKSYTLFSIDDPCIINPLLAAINLNGNSIGVQHGYYSKYNVGYDESLANNWFKHLFVWSNTDQSLIEQLLGKYSSTNLHVGAGFFIPRGFLTYERKSKNIFIVGEENTNQFIQNKTIEYFTSKNFQVITLLKDRSVGLDNRILYLKSLSELQKYNLKLIIGRKSSLVLKFLNQGIPICLLKDDEGYLTDLAQEYGLPVCEDPTSILTYQDFLIDPSKESTNSFEDNCGKFM